MRTPSHGNELPAGLVPIAPLSWQSDHGLLEKSPMDVVFSVMAFVHLALLVPHEENSGTDDGCIRIWAIGISFQDLPSWRRDSWFGSLYNPSCESVDRFIISFHRSSFEISRQFWIKWIGELWRNTISSLEMEEYLWSLRELTADYCWWILMSFGRNSSNSISAPQSDRIKNVHSLQMNVRFRSSHLGVRAFFCHNPWDLIQAVNLFFQCAKLKVFHRRTKLSHRKKSKPKWKP
jgi:hypothetical protein